MLRMIGEHQSLSAAKLLGLADDLLTLSKLVKSSDASASDDACLLACHLLIDVSVFHEDIVFLC